MNIGDWFDENPVWVAVIIITIVLVPVVYLAVVDARRPGFELKKQDWVCTKGHEDTRWIMSGKVLVPMNETVCDQWSRKGA